MSNLTPLSPLLQPVVWQGQEYFTSQYFHQQYVANSPHGGKYRRHSDFVRVIHTIPAYQGYLDKADIVELTWSAVPSRNDVGKQILLSYQPLFQAAGWNPLTLLNATAQVALANFLDDEASKQMAVAANTLVARQASRKPASLLNEEVASRTLAARLEAANLLAVPLHLAQQEAVKAVLMVTGIDYRPMLALAPGQDDIKEDERMLEPTSLAKEFGWGDNQGRRMNLALETVGWQIPKVGSGWEATPAGKPHCALHAFTNKYSGKSEYNLKWNVNAVRHALGLGLAVPHA